MHDAIITKTPKTVQNVGDENTKNLLNRFYRFILKSVI